MRCKLIFVRVYLGVYNYQLHSQYKSLKIIIKKSSIHLIQSLSVVHAEVGTN